MTNPLQSLPGRISTGSSGRVVLFWHRAGFSAERPLGCPVRRIGDRPVVADSRLSPTGGVACAAPSTSSQGLYPVLIGARSLFGVPATEVLPSIHDAAIPKLAGAGVQIVAAIILTEDRCRIREPGIAPMMRVEVLPGVNGPSVAESALPCTELVLTPSLAAKNGRWIGQAKLLLCGTDFHKQKSEDHRARGEHEYGRRCA